jgi:L-ascorbate metabolism protein UlaG (beta-lactamase superfamily)
MQVGDILDIGSCTLRAMPTDHVAQGKAIPNFGILLEDNGKLVYHMSDTRYLFPDSLAIEKKIDLLLVPISDRGLVMGMDDAVHFASQLNPRMVVPIHYDSPKDRDRIDTAAFLQMLDRYGLYGQILDHGQMIEV